MTAVKLPYRFCEVLAALSKNPDGLSAKEIFAVTQLNHGSEVINEKSVSNILYTLKGNNPPQVRMNNSRVTGVYQITPAGTDRLRESLSQADYEFLMQDTKPANQQQDPDFPKLSAAEIATLTDPHVENMTAGIGFIQDTTDIELEAAFDHLRNVIQGHSRPRLPNHDDIIALLKECENSELFEPKKRALFAYARAAIEDAA